jgi:hypothetical protein
MFFFSADRKQAGFKPKPEALEFTMVSPVSFP